MQADLESEQARLATYSEADPSLSGALSDGYRSADAIGRRARTDADQVLKRAVDERRTLAREIQRLRDERESLQDEIASLHRGEMVVVPTTQPEARPPSHDLQTAVMEEMRVLLVELVRDLRARPVVSAPAPRPPVLSEPRAEIVPEAPVREPPTTIVEHVDELVRPIRSEPIVDEDVAELRVPEPIAQSSVPPVEARSPEPAAMTETVQENASSTQQIEAIEPPAPPTVPDARIDALWEAAAPPETTAELAPAPPIEFAPPPPLMDFAPAPAIEFAPEPPIEFAPAPSIDFAPAREAEIVEREAEAWPEPFSEAVPAASPAAAPAPTLPEPGAAVAQGLHQIQIVIAPIHSFPRLLETERRIRALSAVNALRLRDFRNGVATFAVAVAEAISPAEFGAVIQMLQDLHLRLEGSSQSSVELRAEDEPPTA
ncbi:MAG: hypothetical protein E6I28_07300 [Chloroflexi bacterium]|nr:MAG: hypothetical protein E6I28_07300 [Chloroflexota bacterium]